MPTMLNSSCEHGAVFVSHFLHGMIVVGSVIFFFFFKGAGQFKGANLCKQIHTLAVCMLSPFIIGSV